jgi:adenylate cyclase class 2
MKSLEIEVKFYLENVEPVREKLLAAGAKSSGRIFESNICFDDAQDSLKAKQSLLRLRKDKKVTLTHKSKPVAGETEFKVLKELEVEVSNFDKMLSILETLGYHRTLVYEKYRETLSIGNTKLCIDSMPFGDFIEIEGGKADIRSLAQDLGVSWDRRITDNYRSMFEAIQEKLGLPFNDITFDNFSTVQLDIHLFLPEFEAKADQQMDSHQ